MYSLGCCFEGKEGMEMLVVSSSERADRGSGAGEGRGASHEVVPDSVATDQAQSKSLEVRREHDHVNERSESG